MIDKEFQTQQTLLERQKTLNNVMQHLQSEKEQLEKGMQIIIANDAKLTGWLEQNGNVDVDKEILSGVLDDLATQALELQGEDRAADDALYFLDKQIQKGGIDLDAYLQTVRELAKQQFMTKALLKKMQKLC